MQSLSDCEDAMTTTMEDCLAQLVKNCLLPKHAKIRKTCQDALGECIDYNNIIVNN